MPILFDEVRFPEAISYGAKGGPVYATSVTGLANGAEKRSSQWAYPQHYYQLEQNLRSQAQLDVLTAFFHARKGRATGFRFKDWADYTAVNQAIGVGNGSTTVFTLRKRYASGTQTLDRLISKPVSGTVNIYLNSVLQTSGVTIDYTAGLITFATAPASGVVISTDFEFDVPVRFNNDRLLISLVAQGSFSVENIELVEIKIS